MESVIVKALTKPKKNNIKKVIEWCMKAFINEENLRNAIDKRIDIITLALNHYGIGHSTITPLVRIALRLYWEEIEGYLINPQKIREVISSKSGCRQLLNTNKGIEYLNWCCKNAYDKLYRLAWEPSIP